MSIKRYKICSYGVRTVCRLTYLLLYIQELIKLKCLDLPCSLSDIANIYTWSCSFCHTGKKEYVWLSLKALEVLAPLFLYEEQKKYQIDITTLWRRKSALTESSLIELMRDYKGFLKPIYYFRDEFSIKGLQDSLNNSNNKNLAHYTFHLSETELGEVEYFYCTESKEHY